MRSIGLLQLATMGLTFRFSAGIDSISEVECLCVFMCTLPVGSVVWVDINRSNTFLGKLRLSHTSFHFKLILFSSVSESFMMNLVTSFSVVGISNFLYAGSSKCNFVQKTDLIHMTFCLSALCLPNKRCCKKAGT